MVATNRCRCLVTGATGQLGRELVLQLGEQAIPKTHENLDVTSPKQVTAAIGGAKPDIVIHTAAFTDWMQAENQRDECWRVNAEAVAHLVNVCAARGVPLIHISCDSVFGLAGGDAPRGEDDPVAPVNFHGQSKVAGEHAFLRAAQALLPAHWKAGFRYWLVRTSTLYERPWRPGRNLAWELLSIADRGRSGKVGMPTNIFRSPTYVPHLAKALLWLVQNRVDVPCGVYHVANSGSASLYDFAVKLASAVRSSLAVEEVSHDDLARLHGYASRLCPRNTALDCSRFDGVCNLVMPCWQEAILEFAKHWRKRSAYAAVA